MYLKDITKKLLQSILGFETYLYYFSLFKLHALPYDPDEQTIFRFIDLIPERSLILDVGANLGFITWHLAQKRACTVLAIEPIPANLKVLTRIVATKKLANVMILPCALGNQTAAVEMVMPVENGVPLQGFSHVKTSDNQDVGHVYTVPMQRLDDLTELANRDERVGGIKIDAEDYEYFILLGGLTVIQKYRPVIYVELWDNETRRQALALLASLGYTSHLLYKGNLLEWTGQAIDFPENNFICLPPQPVAGTVANAPGNETAAPFG